MKKSETITLMVLGGAFMMEAAVAAGKGKLPEVPPAVFWVLLGLAAYRGGRAVSFNLIFKWLRDLLGVAETPDSSGAGNSNNATGHGPKYILAELVCCPICSATWVAMTLIAIYSIHETFGLALIYGLGAAGVAEILTWMSEHYEWSGRESREASGSYWLEKNTTQSIMPPRHWNSHSTLVEVDDARQE